MNLETNKLRKELFNLIENNKYIYFHTKSNHQDYIKKLGSSKFSICPIGNGLDTHRFWESLIVGTVPIVKKSDFIENFKNHNLPILIVEDWRELNNFSEIDLDNLFEEKLALLKNTDSIYLKYWNNYITQFKI